jgi:hypothetical protein
MAYNTLSGTVVANRTVVFKENGGDRDDPTRNRVMGEFYGDGTNIDNVARVVANGINDYLVTVGVTEQSLVGEQNLRFNGSRLYVNGDVTASAVQLNGLSSEGALLNSFLALDSNNNIVRTSSFIGSTTFGQGPINSIQIHSGSGDIIGSSNFIFDPTANALYIGGEVTSSYLNLASIPQSLNTEDTFLLSIDVSGNIFKSNPTPYIGIQHAVRFEVDNKVTSSGDFTYNPSSGLVQLTGDLVVTGTIQANTFDILHTNITEIDLSGSTNFGDTDDDIHTFSGSLQVMSSSNVQFSVSAVDNTTSINTGVIFNRIAVTSNYSVAKDNHIIGVDSTSAPITITLPDASVVGNGQVFVIKDEGGASYSNNIIIQASGSQKINGANTAVLSTPYTAIHIYGNGQNNFFTY